MEISEKFFDIFTKLGQWRLKQVEKALNPLSISHTDLHILMLLYEKESLTQEEISSQAIVDRSNVGRALKKLEKRNLIAKKKNSRDKRTFNVILTEKGKEFKEEAYKIKKNIVQIFAANLSEKDIETIIKLLSKMKI